MFKDFCWKDYQRPTHGFQGLLLEGLSGSEKWIIKELCWRDYQSPTHGFQRTFVGRSITVPILDFKGLLLAGLSESQT